MPTDFPSQVTDTTPTYLVGGDAAANGGAGGFAKALVGSTGLTLLATTSTSTAQAALGAGTAGAAIFAATTTGAAQTAIGATALGSSLLTAANPNAALVALGSGAVNAVSANYSLVAGDNAKTVVASNAPVLTVNTGLPAGFGCTIVGAVTFAGSATVTDNRTSGATSPICGLIAVGTDAYVVAGGKP